MSHKHKQSSGKHNLYKQVKIAINMTEIWSNMTLIEHPINCTTYFFQ